MKQKYTLAYLRQLCSLGLDKDCVIPEFLRAVQAVIPSSNNVFTGCDNQFNPTYVIFEQVTSELIQVAPEIVPCFFNRERRGRFARWFSQNSVSTESILLDKNFYNTDFYNLVWRIHDQHYFVQSPVTKNGQIIGMPCLFRPRSQKPFNSNEQALFTRLMPYLTHALQTHNTDDIQYCESGQSGMMVMDTEGAILFQSESAKRLLQLAQHPLIPTDALAKEGVLMQKLAQLCRNLDAIFQGKDAAPPSWCHTNGRGRFTFRAYWLDRQNREPGGVVGMTIEHQEPLTLKILRTMQDLPLSPTQKEVAMLLARGASTEKIGERLHIKYSTVKDHISKIFDKLDIHHREELLPKLLALEKERLIQL
jgi:DNA-binding CsgD family transcriptional regulator